jgi:P27 family predicted phage terminase small subunit
MRGTFRADRHSDEVQPKAEARAQCPAWLAGEARKKWKALVPKLREVGVLTVVDGDALAAYCQAWCQWRRLQVWIGEHGEVYPIKDSKGNLKRFATFPQAIEARNLYRVIHRYQCEFGMTPSSRTSIRAENEEAQADEFDRFIGENAHKIG